MGHKKILILGGYGNTGLPLARLLLAETDVQLVLAGRHINRAQSTAAQLNREFPGERVSGIAADAADKNNLSRALHDVDILVVASSTAKYASQVAETTLSAGVDYLDVQYATQKVAALKSLASEIESAGLCFITEAGFHPGLPAALVRYAGERFDRLDIARVGSVIKLDWQGYEFSDSTVVELLEELNDFQMLLYKDGAWRKASMISTRDYISMDFGAEFGKQFCAPMFLEEMRYIPKTYPSLKETGFFIGGFNPVVDWLIMPLAMLATRISPQAALKPMSRLMHWGLVRFSRPPYGTLLRLEAQGDKAGVASSLTVTLHHPDGYMFTAIPVAACLLQYLDGSISSPGLWLQAEIVDPGRLLEDMRRMGVAVSIEETPRQVG